MKTTKMMRRLVLGAMLIFTATATFAGDGGKTTGNVSILPYLDTDYSIVSLSNQADKAAIFSINDAQGETVYKEWVNKEGFAQKILDFSNLEDGEYTAVLKARGAEKISKTFSVADHKLVSERTQVVTEQELRAFFNLVDNMLYVSHISFGSNTFGISISDAIGDEIFEKGFDGNSTFSGKFDISALPTGEYKVSINSGNKEYSYAFSK
ncbi:T9SS type A sorting domain-containing protein [Saccharicrinis fermentans]|uniref:MG2 domain protein n=1 Tax=Saccharicrinis fermentans DSM 9555 = JCM 21142 TaxID=869213 RepID=W7Y3C9_9BACT|nr:hypothetical protein [Saccharicrinis fermentans]GAF05355.1 MG2 domain protein [Saccharicrinis fermentans DSM 9555 = JCM 21142]